MSSDATLEAGHPRGESFSDTTPSGAMLCAPTASLPAPLPLPGSASESGDASQTAASEFRKWTSSDGKSTVEAKLVGKNGDQVQLERRDGKVVTVPLIRLSTADVEFVKTPE